MNPIMAIVSCCENCAREHSFPKNKRYGTCTFLEKNGAKEQDVHISRFGHCKNYVTDTEKKTKMSEF